MGLKVVHEGGVRFRADCRGHSVTMDQPVEDAGSDAGMTPPELFAASLCLLHTTLQQEPEISIELAEETMLA